MVYANAITSLRGTLSTGAFYCSQRAMVYIKYAKKYSTIMKQDFPFDNDSWSCNAQEMFYGKCEQPCFVCIAYPQQMKTINTGLRSFTKCNKKLS